MATVCTSCGNHTLMARMVAGAAVEECEVCGEIYGAPEIVELLELQAEAESIGCSPYSFPLAQFLESLPGVRVLGDSGGTPSAGSLPWVSFELADHRTTQLENLAQSLRLMRDELQNHWVLEFTYDYQLGFEMRPRHGGKLKFSADDVDTARDDLLLIWRRLQGFTGLGWWRR